MRFPHYELSAYQARSNPFARGRLGAASLELRGVDELLALASDEQREEWARLTLSYAPERGTPELRDAIALNYPGLDSGNVAVFSSATEALFCVLHASVSAGDRSAVVTPCYEPLAKIPESIGAEVTALPLERDAATRRWTLDAEALEAMAKQSDQLMINFPHNPTGALITQGQLDSLAAVCERTGTRLISDEVFRGLEHEASSRLSPVACITDRGVSVGSIAKPHGVGGVRIGWAVSQDTALLERAVDIRRTLSVCSGTTDEWLARLVLAHSTALRERSLATLGKHIDLVEASLERLGGVLTWTRPEAGCMAFPLLRKPVAAAADAIKMAPGQEGRDSGSDHWARRCLEETGIMLIPSRCFVGGVEPRFAEGVRLGYGLADFPSQWSAFVDFLAPA